MIDIAILGFAFIQGIVAFFAPCAVALLPGYVSHFLTTVVKSASKRALFLSALLYGSVTVLGVGLVFGITGALIFSLQQFIKPVIVYVTVALGIAMIIYGILLIMGKSVSLSFHGPQAKGSPVKQSFMFGIFYAIAALGCLFPLFLGVVTLVINANSFVAGASYFLAYFLGMGILLFAVYVGVVFAGSYLQKNIVKVLPYIYKISGVLLILGGLYVINYQRGLLF